MIWVVHPGSRIRMLTFSHPGSRIQRSKRHPIPDPGSGSATLHLWLTIVILRGFFCLSGNTIFVPRISCSLLLHVLQICLNVFFSVLGIHDILRWIRIRIRGSMPLTNGSGFGFGSCYFRHWPSRCQQKTNFLTQFFLLITFLSYIYIIIHR